ncbi:hypothetical protein U0E23_03230 [Burkholderia stagnalis]|nr:hypothetical protein [Burkholderia stagnalis]MDY7801485.1 hypothetical protein [Burkholderia stagnalis]
MKKTIIALTLVSPVLSARARYEDPGAQPAMVRVTARQIKGAQ